MNQRKQSSVPKTSLQLSVLHLFISLTVASILLTMFVFTAKHYPQLIKFDRDVASFMQNAHHPLLTVVVKVITWLGSSTVTILIAILALLYAYLLQQKYSLKAIMLAVCLSGTYATNALLKYLFKRPRPDELALVLVSGYSFPSGHAMVSFAFYGLLGYLFWVAGGSLKSKITASLFWILALAIGASRIYLGAHFPSDVLAGFAAGGVWLIGCIIGLHIFQTRSIRRLADDTRKQG